MSEDSKGIGGALVVVLIVGFLIGYSVGSSSVKQSTRRHLEAINNKFENAQDAMGILENMILRFDSEDWQYLVPQVKSETQYAADTVSSIRLAIEDAEFASKTNIVNVSRSIQRVGQQSAISTAAYPLTTQPLKIKIVLHISKTPPQNTRMPYEI